MQLSPATAKAGLDAKIVDAVRLRIFTADYVTELAVVPIAFGVATDACPSVATVGATPISGTWAATGTAGAYRVTNAAGDVIKWFDTGAAAVATTGTPDVLLSTLNAVSGAAVSLNSMTLTEVCS